MKNKKKINFFEPQYPFAHLGVGSLHFYECLNGLDQDDINASA